jgi:hypothetical protein
MSDPATGMMVFSMLSANMQANKALTPPPAPPEAPKPKESLPDKERRVQRKYAGKGRTSTMLTGDSLG